MTPTHQPGPFETMQKWLERRFANPWGKTLLAVLIILWAIGTLDRIVSAVIQ